MMTREFRDKWVAALRSGDYQQGRNYLCRNGKHCCLGVAYEIEGVADKSEELLTTIVYFDGIDDCPPVDVLARWGIGDSDLAIRLVDMNDGTSRGDEAQFYTFAKIADFIETLPVEEDAA